MISSTYKNFFLLLLTALLVAGCLRNTNNNNVAQPSDDASILRVQIANNDKSPYAASAVFTINNVTDSIFNVDSLPHGTRVDSLYLNFGFASSFGFVMNDTVSQSNMNTAAQTTKAFDLTNPITIKNLATDGKSTKTYTIQLRVHKVETYLHTWTKLTDQIAASPAENQCAVLLNDKFHFYAGSKHYTSTDAAQWTENTASTGLPADAVLRNIVVFNNTAYLLHGGNTLYQSADGNTWTSAGITSADAGYMPKTLLFAFKNKLWAVAQHTADNTLRVMTSADGISWATSGKKTFTDDFPVSGFGATAFKPPYGTEKVIVIGGLSPSGKRLNTIWTAEDKIITDTLNWLNLQTPKSNLGEISDAATGFYGSRLLLIGGATNTLPVDTLQLRQSTNEGMSWLLPDTTINRMPNDFIPRTNISLINDKKDNSLYLVGGKSAIGTRSDVWKIKVNFYNFADYKANPYKY